MAKKEEMISTAEAKRVRERKPQVMAAERVSKRAVMEEYKPIYYLYHSCGTEDCAKLTIDRVSITIDPPTGVGNVWAYNETATFNITVTNTTDAKLRDVQLVVSIVGPAGIIRGAGRPWVRCWYNLGDLNPGQAVNQQVRVRPIGNEGGDVTVEAKINAEVVPFAESRVTGYSDTIIGN